MGTPDIQSAALGSGAVRDFEAHLYIGTSSWLTCHVPFKKTDLFHNMATLPSAIPGKYLIANEQETAGACLKYLVCNILYPDDETAGPPPPDVFDLLNRVAERVPAGCDKLIFTPWLFGERTPVDDHTVRSGFHNQTLRTKREHFIRAVFEGVGFNSRWLLMYLEKIAGNRMGAINIIGGGAKSDVWCQIHADILNREIRQVKDPIHANVKGAAMLACVALGYQQFESISGWIEIDKIFKPNQENRKIYDELFDAFVSIYKKNRGIYAKLNRTA